MSKLTGREPELSQGIFTGDEPGLSRERLVQMTGKMLAEAEAETQFRFFEELEQLLGVRIEATYGDPFVGKTYAGFEQEVDTDVVQAAIRLLGEYLTREDSVSVYTYTCAKSLLENMINSPQQVSGELRDKAAEALTNARF